MSFTKETKDEIIQYCNNHLPEENWYKKQFDFILDEILRDRLIKEFKAIRFAYKLYEGIEATEENLLFEVRNQILAYASIYEAVIENVLEEYYSDTEEYELLNNHVIPVKIDIPKDKISKLTQVLEHDEKNIVPFYYAKKRKEKTQVRFDDKCRTAEKIGLVHSFVNDKGIIVRLPEELIEIYSYRNGIHLIAEQRKGISYEINLSKKAYRRMKPFIEQIKEKLREDGKYTDK